MDIERSNIIKARMWEIIQINNQLNAEYQKLYQELEKMEKEEMEKRNILENVDIKQE